MSNKERIEENTLKVSSISSKVTALQSIVENLPEARRKFKSICTNSSTRIT